MTYLRWPEDPVSRAPMNFNRATKLYSQSPFVLSSMVLSLWPELIISPFILFFVLRFPGATNRWYKLKRYFSFFYFFFQFNYLRCFSFYSCPSTVLLYLRWSLNLRFTFYSFIISIYLLSFFFFSIALFSSVSVIVCWRWTFFYGILMKLIGIVLVETWTWELCIQAND